MADLKTIQSVIKKALRIKLIEKNLLTWLLVWFKFKIKSHGNFIDVTQLIWLVQKQPY